MDRFVHVGESSRNRPRPGAQCSESGVHVGDRDAVGLHRVEEFGLLNAKIVCSIDCGLLGVRIKGLFTDDHRSIDFILGGGEQTRRARRRFGTLVEHVHCAGHGEHHASGNADRAASGERQSGDGQLPDAVLGPEYRRSELAEAADERRDEVEEVADSVGNLAKCGREVFQCS